MSVGPHRNLEVWKRTHHHVLAVYRISSGYPKEETYGLAQHTRKSAVSSASNIVEGKARKSTMDYLRFLNIAIASLEETRYQLFLGKDLGYIGEIEFQTLDIEMSITARKLISLMNSLEKRL